MAEKSPLYIEALEDGDVVVLLLQGIVNEDNLLLPRTGAFSNRKILLDLEKVSRLNSCGIRDWATWVQQLESQGNELYFTACSPVIIAQVNMVRNFCGANGRVLSFQAPYYCQTCACEQQELQVTTAVTDPTTAAPALCQTCGEPLEFDDIPENYFKFVRRHGDGASPEVASLLRRAADAKMATKVAALKEITSSRSSGITGTTSGGTDLGLKSRSPKTE